MSSQHGTQDGQGNILVQVAGNGIDVAIGLVGNRLHLARRHLRTLAVKKELDLLNPFSRAIPLVGRAEELADLQDWLRGPAPISARCLIGRGGAGKTRLALELCAWAEGLPEAERWHAGFAMTEPTGGSHLAGLTDPSGWRWAPRTLVVVDYAAAKGALLRSLLLALLERTEPDQPHLRLLLLERHADPERGWWRELMGASDLHQEGLADLFDPPAPVQLRRIEQAAEQRAVLDAVMTRASELHGLVPPLLPPGPGADLAFDRRLADPALAHEPLHLAMAGLSAVQAGLGNLLALPRTDLANMIAQLELERIAKLASARGVGREFAQHMAAVVTLTAGADVEKIEAVIAAEQQALSLPGTGDPPIIAGVLREALPGETPDRIAPVLPDIIGEAAILQGLGRRPGNSLPAMAQAAAERAFRRDPEAVLAALLRTAQDHADTDDHKSLRWLDALAQQVEGNALGWFIDQFPEQTVRLRPLKAALQERWLAHVRTLVADDPSRQVKLARAVGNLANGLAALGRREAALAAAEEAVALYRKLAAARPDAFRPDLAASLNNLGATLSELGRREAALAAAEEAVALYRELAAARPGAFRPNLGASLNNLAASLSALGRREAALAAAEEAVALYRELAAACPDAFRPNFGASLNNLANRLSELGRREAALAAAEEAVALYRELAAARPEAFRPNLGASLNNLTNRLSELGRGEAALAAAEEAVALYRELTAARPDAFRPDLAPSLNNLANVLSEHGRGEEALAATEEAVALYRELAAARPDAFRQHLAESLNNFAATLHEVGWREAALAAAEEAVALYRELAAARPEAFAVDLARSLAGLGMRRRAAEDDHGGAAFLAEALTTITPAVRSNPVALSGLTKAMLHEYFASLETIKQTPDVTLVGPLIAPLKQRPSRYSAANS